MSPDDDVNRAFLSIAATRISFTGGTVVERRLLHDTGYTFEPGEKAVALKNRSGGTTATITCECALEGGNCGVAIFNPGGPDEFAACVPDQGCGSSGLFCFMQVAFGVGVTLRFKM